MWAEEKYLAGSEFSPASRLTDDTNPIPASLKVVAFLFFVGGIFSVVEIIISLAHWRFNFNFGVLGLFIGPGLMRLSPGWRTCALVFLWFGMIGIPIGAILLLSFPGPIDLNLLGQEIGHAPKGLSVVLLAIMFVFEVWQFHVLTRDDMRELFGLPEELHHGRMDKSK